MTTEAAGQGPALSEGLGPLADQREGQAHTMLITCSRDEFGHDAGHWYSPAAVRAMLAAERERCANVCEVLVSEWDGAIGKAALARAANRIRA